VASQNHKNVVYSAPKMKRINVYRSKIVELISETIKPRDEF